MLCRPAYIMALSIHEQIKHLIDDKKHILITFRKDGKGDCIGSALGLALYLQKLGKQVDIVCEDFQLPRTFKFLKSAESIRSKFSHLRQFIITIDVQESGVQELSYDVKDGKLRIFVTPKHGAYNRDNMSTGQSNFKYDLIFALDSADLHSLGNLYQHHSEFFYKTPIINIDHHSENEQFGQVNLVDVTASTSAEILLDLFEQLGSEYIDTNISTALLTGIIAHTRSFKTDAVKPQTLTAASKLISLGADRDFIVHNLFRTRSIAALKLWGAALTHLQNESDIGLVSTVVTKDDVQRSGAEKQDIAEIVDELISNSPEAKITLLLHEDTVDNKYAVQIILLTDKGHNALQLLADYKAKGSANYATATLIETPLTEALDNIKINIREKLKK